MSRAGDNRGGQGGRDYRFNWGRPIADGPYAFGDWRIVSMYSGTTLPWIIFYKGAVMQRMRLGRSMARRFKTAENAQRWVELYSRDSREQP